MRQSYEVGVVSNASLDYTDVPIKKRQRCAAGVGPRIESLGML